MAELLRRLHPRRALDIVAGSILNKTRRTTEADFQRLSKTLQKSRADLNDQIRAASPSIYLVDPDVIAAAFISGVWSQLGSVLYSNEKKFNRLNSQEGLKFVSDLVRRVLLASNKPKPVYISEVSQELGSIYSRALEDFTNLSKKSKQPYIEYQRIAARAGASTRKYLNNIGVARIIDADTMVSNLSGRLAYIAPTFQTAVSNINTLVMGALQSQHITKEFGYRYTQFFDLSIGNLVHAGHVGIYNEDKFLGINMPSGMISGVVSGKMQEVEQALGALPIHIESGIKLTPNYTERAGMFLDMQFNFVVSMPAELNSKILGPQEQNAIKSAAGNITNEALAQALKTQVGVESLRDLVAVTAASPTFKEFIVDTIVNILSGKKTSSVKHTRSEKGSREVIKQSSSTVVNRSSGKKATAPTKSKPKISQVQVQHSLVDLQNIINSQLHQRIKQNMVQPALQNRTGRFAESAKVERLSESRAGMITAFYSYMKSPYQTFQPGFRQGSEKRNPKTLISKSIREIASTIVGNRLRSVAL